MSLITPAVLPSSKQDLLEKLSIFAHFPRVERIQIDVVDREFAKAATWPYTAPSELDELVSRHAVLPYADKITYEMDLMCTHPDIDAGAWLSLGATRLTLHIASTTDPKRLIHTLRKKHGDLFSIGLALHIEANPMLVEPHLKDVEYVQFMGIAHIGRQGQPLDERVFGRIESFHKRNPNVNIQVDGGVTIQNARKLLSLGATRLVVGSGILKAKNPVSAYEEFENLKSSYGV